MSTAEPILRWFQYQHLTNPRLRAVSAIFCEAAQQLCHLTRRNDQRTAALCRLLEAKDTAVRAEILSIESEMPEGIQPREI